MWTFLLWLIALIIGGVLVRHASYDAYKPAIMIEPHMKNGKTQAEGACKLS